MRCSLSSSTLSWPMGPWSTPSPASLQSRGLPGLGHPCFVQVRTAFRREPHEDAVHNAPAAGSSALPQTPSSPPAADKASASAQPQLQAPPLTEAQIESIRTEVRAGKSDLIAKNVPLTASEAAAFWPLYKQYEAAGKAINDKRSTSSRSTSTPATRRTRSWPPISSRGASGATSTSRSSGWTGRRSSRRCSRRGRWPASSRSAARSRSSPTPSSRR